MSNQDAFLSNVIVIKNTIIQHFSAVSEQNSIIFNEINANAAQKNIEIKFSFISNITGKRHVVSDYRIPSLVMLSNTSDELLRTEYFNKFNEFVRDNAASYLEYAKSEKIEIMISESINFIKKAWPHIIFIGSVLYILSL